MAIQFQNARILTPFSQMDGVVLVSGERIVEVSRSIDAPRGTQVIDARNLYLVPGYIDLQVYGGGGRHVMEATDEAVAALCDAHALEGTTTLLPTTRYAPQAEDIVRAAEAVRVASLGDLKATIAGVHIQGLFPSSAYEDDLKKSHTLRTPADADWRTMLERCRHARIVGLAPELPGAFSMGEYLREHGIVASISYSDASYDQVLGAISHGFSDVSNIFTHCSAMQTLGGLRVPGVSECALTMDEMTVQLVADGKRLPMMMLQIIYRCKGTENIMLVSGAGADGQATMSALVRNMVAAGAPLRVALRMATVNPARRIGLESSKGRIGEGYDADILLLDEALNVRFIMSKGKILRDELSEIK